MSAIFQTPITIYGAARTDAGVHARGQVVNFYGQESIPTEKIPYAMKGYLPPEIAVLSAREMPNRFSVRHDNVGKHYRYSIDNNRMHDPFLLRYAWFIRKPLDRQAMREGAAIHVLDIDVVGDGFLYHMVRNIAGGLVDLGLHRLTPERFREILASGDRTQLGATAPAQGLCLETVFYDEGELKGRIAELEGE